MARNAREARPCRVIARVHTTRKRKRRSEEHTSELQSRRDLVCRLLLEKKKKQKLKPWAYRNTSTHYANPYSIHAYTTHTISLIKATPQHHMTTYTPSRTVPHTYTEHP